MRWNVLFVVAAYGRELVGLIVGLGTGLSPATAEAAQAPGSEAEQEEDPVAELVGRLNLEGYSFDDWNATFRTSGGRRITVGGNLRTGDFWNGRTLCVDWPSLAIGGKARIETGTPSIGSRNNLRAMAARPTGSVTVERALRRSGVWNTTLRRDAAGVADVELVLGQVRSSTAGKFETVPAVPDIAA